MRSRIRIPGIVLLALPRWKYTHITDYKPTSEDGRSQTLGSIPGRVSIISASWIFGTRSFELPNSCTFDAESVVTGNNKNSCFVVEAREDVSFDWVRAKHLGYSK